MQTILGSGGAIGTELARELLQYTDRIRLVSRNPKKVNPGDETFSTDITNPERLEEAIKGSGIVYVTVGFEYNSRVWEETWPPFMSSVVDICKRQGCKLVFFDNMYLYDPSEVPHMTEGSRINPSSRKGKVRAGIHRMIMEEVNSGRLEALIARAADFYGPGIRNSVVQEMALKNLAAGKSAYWFMNGNRKHAFTYTPDAAKATAILGNTDDAYGQVWHLPTHNDPPTGKQLVRLFAEELNVKPKMTVMPGALLTLLSLFTPVLKEFREMAYQWDRDYIFDSSKFEERFGFKPISYEEGVRKVVEAFKV